MAFKFNFSVNQTVVENPVLKDLNEYPLFDSAITLDSATNSVDLLTEPKLLVLTGYTIVPFLSTTRLIRVTTQGGNVYYVTVKKVVTNGADVEIWAYDAFEESFDNATIEMLRLLGNTSVNEAVPRNLYATVLFLTHKPTDGDSSIDLSQDNLKFREGSEWPFVTDNGGWFILEAYAVERYRDSDSTGPVSYQQHEIVFELDNNGKVIFYRSLVNSNTDALTETLSWDAYPLDEFPTQEEFSNAVNLVTNGSYLDSYIANIFVDRKLELLRNELSLKVACDCVDACDIPELLKIAMYEQQISTLVEFSNFTTAQNNYEKALELAQDAVNG